MRIASTRSNTPNPAVNPRYVAPNKSIPPVASPKLKRIHAKNHIPNVVNTFRMQTKEMPSGGFFSTLLPNSYVFGPTYKILMLDSIKVFQTHFNPRAKPKLVLMLTRFLTYTYSLSPTLTLTLTQRAHAHTTR